jgi:uncharacterized membrane protein
MDALGSTVEHRASAARVVSIDIARGIVMVLMAIDHVRVYSGLPAGGPDPGIFFTRWITHFCAPAFVFFAGTSAFLYGRTRPTREITAFLATRGMWLIVLELTVIRLAWTFNVDYADYVLLGVIWMLGACMVLMAAVVFLPVGVIAGIGLVIVAGHNAIDPFLPSVRAALEGSGHAVLWRIIYFGPDPLGVESSVAVLYSLVPWMGVMMTGYAFGWVLERDADRRRRWCLRIGLSAIVIFLVLRGFNLYGNPSPWSGSFLSFLNTAKYPASLSFLLMTLGPTIALLPTLETWRSRTASVLEVFGRVPFFYYLLHIPLIHALAMIVSVARLGYVSPWLFGNHPMAPPPVPEGYAWSLLLLYVVWLVAVAMLYPACRWFDRLKRTRRSAWLRYV